MTSPPSILVLGAGTLGLSVLTSLATSPDPPSLTVLLRPSPSKSTLLSHLHSLNISILPSDIATSTESQLAALFRPFHTIIGCTGMTFPPGTQLKLTHAVLEAGVQRYLPWQFGVDYDAIGRESSQGLFTEQLDVRELLRAQTRLDWVIVSVGMFMDFLFWPEFGVVGEEGGVVRALGAWDNRVTVTAVEDIGRVVAELVIGEVKGDGRVVFVAGETISYGGVADVVERVGGGKVERVERSVQVLKEELTADPENGLKKYAVVFAEGKGVSWREEDTFNIRSGMKLQGVEAWVREHLKYS